MKCVCFGGEGDPRPKRYVTQGDQASECYGALRGGGDQNRKFLRYVFFERPLYGFRELIAFLFLFLFFYFKN